MFKDVAGTGLVALIGAGEDDEIHGDNGSDDTADQPADDDIDKPLAGPITWRSHDGSVSWAAADAVSAPGARAVFPR